MIGVSTVYSIDTSALMAWYYRRYPPKVFPGLVPHLEKLIADGRLRASEYVRTELGSKKDPLFDWADAQHVIFIQTDSAVSALAAQLIQKYPLLVDPSSLRPVQADPYVIALAGTRNWVVVTEETYAKTKTSGKWKNRTYIPDMCLAENIQCINFLEMMQQENWAI